MWAKLATPNFSLFIIVVLTEPICDCNGSFDCIINAPFYLKQFILVYKKAVQLKEFTFKLNDLLCQLRLASLHF